MKKFSTSIIKSYQWLLMSFLLFCSLSDIFHSGQGIQGKKQSPTTWVFLYIFFIENKIFFLEGCTSTKLFIMMIYFELGIWLVKIFNSIFCGLYQAGKNIQKLLGGNDWKDVLLLSQLCYNLFFGTVTITFLITLLKIKHDFLCLLKLQVMQFMIRMH